LDFLERTSFRDSILAFDPGLLKSLAALKKFLFEVFATYSNFVSLFSSKPSKYGCFRAYAAVIRFCGSKIIIFYIRSIAYSEALGINCYNDVGTNFGKLKPIFAAN